MDEIRFDFPGVFRLYKSGRIDRLIGTDFVPASVDPAADGVSTKDVTIDSATGVTARLYLPKIARGDRVPVLVYFHGGAFCVGSPFCATYDAYVRSVASRTNLLVVSVNYRMAPEHPLPAAYDDCWTAVRWVASAHAEEKWIEDYGDATRIFVAGDSAGGNIAHRMAVRAGENRDGVGIERVALVHPYFWGREAVGREITGAAEREWMEGLWKSVTGAEADEAWIDARAEEAVRCRGLRRVLVCVAERDWLCERGRAYCDAARRSGWGGEVELVVAEGEEHTFHLSKPECDKALELMDRLAAFFS